MRTRMIQAPTFSLSPAHRGALDYSYQIFFSDKIYILVPTRPSPSPIHFILPVSRGRNLLALLGSLFPFCFEAFGTNVPDCPRCDMSPLLAAPFVTSLFNIRP